MALALPSQAFGDVQRYIKQRRAGGAAVGFAMFNVPGAIIGGIIGGAIGAVKAIKD